MRAWLAVIIGLALGGGLAWWLAQEHEHPAGQRRPDSPRPGAQVDASPALYRWRDDAGVLQITERPPKDRRYERIDRDTPAGIRVSGDGVDTQE
ncbi:DUF4124 domain-containing protein [Pseudoxanthomonas mexicana]